MKRTALKRKTPLRILGQSETAELKRQIQSLVRDIVIKRDGGCILREHPHAPPCNGRANDGHLILQADHLITRGNSATYADTRLVVCVCKGHHGWKKWHKEQYDTLVKELIGPARLALWQRAHEDRYRPMPMRASDWKLTVVALKAEYGQLLNSMVH